MVDGSGQNAMCGMFDSGSRDSSGQNIDRGMGHIGSDSGNANAKLVLLFQSHVSLLLKLLKASNHMPTFLGTIELLVKNRGQGRRHEIPRISAVVIALLVEPQIDYTLKAVGGSLTAIHGLLDMID